MDISVAMPLGSLRLNFRAEEFQGVKRHPRWGWPMHCRMTHGDSERRETALDCDAIPTDVHRTQKYKIIAIGLRRSEL